LSRQNLRCFLPPEDWKAGEVELAGSQAHHLIHVLRLTRGAVLTCFDGRGQEADAVVTTVGRRTIGLELSAQRTVSAPPYAVDLAVAIPGHGKFEQIVDQATQLGVHALIPLLTERAAVRWTPDQAEKKMDRLVQVAIEAGKQSKVAFLPEIHSLIPLKEIMGTFDRYDQLFICTGAGPHEPLGSLMQGKTGTVLVLIGPEGDWTPEELKQAVDAGAHPISLGPTVLRCETAAVAAVAQIMFLIRERS